MHVTKFNESKGEWIASQLKIKISQGTVEMFCFTIFLSSISIKFVEYKILENARYIIIEDFYFEENATVF